jgi:TrmH family RNA methyltransferase
MRPFRYHHDVIDSRNHHAIKRIRRLHERAERDRTGLSYIEGMRFVARAVQHRVPIEALVTCRPLLTHPFARHLVRQLRQTGTPILEVTPDVLSSVALVDDPQGIGAVMRQCWTPLERIVPASDSCWPRSSRHG